MSLSHTITVLDALESPRTTGKSVADLVGSASGVDVSIERLMSARGRIDLIRIVLEGSRGRRSGGDAPSLGIVGRPDEPGSGADAPVGSGAVIALAAARKLVAARRAGGILANDVIIVTQVEPDRQVGSALPSREPHVDDREIAGRETAGADGAVLSIGRVADVRIAAGGLALTPTVRRGTILPASPDLLDLLAQTTGATPSQLAVSAYDLELEGRGSVAHLLRPHLATTAPVAALAITTGGLSVAVARETLLGAAVHAAVTIARSVSGGACAFHDAEQYRAWVERRLPAALAL